jgi:CHAT domain-containing protein
MASFYRYYVGQGVSKGAALRRSILEVKEDWRHPYFWAPLVLFGDWE